MSRALEDRINKLVLEISCLAECLIGRNDDPEWTGHQYVAAQKAVRDALGSLVSEIVAECSPGPVLGL